MAKVLMLSVLVATVAMPSLAARDSSPWRGLLRLIVATFAFSVLYWAIVMFLVPSP
jgi:hypothetical protein